MKGGDGERACLLLCSGTEALHVSMYRCALTSQEDGALSSVYLDPAIRCHVRRLILGATKWVDSVDSANKTDTAPLNMPQVKEMLSDGFPPKLGPQFQQCLIARQGPQRLVFLGGKGLKRELGIRAAPQGMQRGHCEGVSLCPERKRRMLAHTSALCDNGLSTGFRLPGGGDSVCNKKEA